MQERTYISEVEFIDIFADNLRDAMVEVGISQAELAYEAGLTKVTINRYLNKQRFPTLKAVVNICHVLDCDIDDIIPTMYLIN